MPNAKEVAEALEARRHDTAIIGDKLSQLQKSSANWREEVELIYRLYDNDFDVVWPDGMVTRSQPKIPNYISLSADDRSREVISSRPTILCGTYAIGDKAKQQAEKLERILRGYWEDNDIEDIIGLGALDQMLTGLTAVRVLPDTGKPLEERYPRYTLMSPLCSYPDPLFTQGPWVDSFINSYESNLRTVEKQYGVDLHDFRRNVQTANDKCVVIEFYDDDDVVVVVEANSKRGNNAKTREIVSEFKHGLSHCPVVVRARPSGTRTYRSEFLSGVGAMNILNRFATLALDDAIGKVYGLTGSYDVENPDDIGPGSHLIYSSEKARFDFLTPGNQPFSNLQLMRDLTGGVRAAVIMPPARSGDPNESIISAAGTNAVQGQFIADVRNLQNQTIAKLLTAANQLALEVDEKWCDAKKPICYYAGARAETYTPSKDIAGNYRNQVTYGQTAGLDPLNTNVMALQQLGAGGISIDTFMEQSIFVDDPTREKKRITLSHVDQAVESGLIAQAGQGQLTAFQLADIRRLLESDEVTLHDAISSVVPSQPAPLAPPAAGPAGGAPTQAPGLAGAGEGQSLPQNQPQLPALADLMGH